jgi:hypothetical protein
MTEHQCCICKNTTSGIELSTTALDPCALILISNIDQPREKQKEQQFFCHFDCFRKLVNNDGIMYIMDSDFSTIGECKEDEGVNA